MKKDYSEQEYYLATNRYHYKSRAAMRTVIVIGETHHGKLRVVTNAAQIKVVRTDQIDRHSALGIWRKKPTEETARDALRNEARRKQLAENKRIRRMRRTPAELAKYRADRQLGIDRQQERFRRDIGNLYAPYVPFINIKSPKPRLVPGHDVDELIYAVEQMMETLRHYNLTSVKGYGLAEKALAKLKEI